MAADELGAQPAASPAADYAPSPNTCSQALARANQLRVQGLLRQLLLPAGATTAELGHRLNALRVLRRTMRELDYQLSWLTQVDLFETMERILRNETLDSDSDWRLIHDTSQLILETLPRSGFEPDAHTLGQIFASAVQNLGHKRSEVRRVSLLLINMQFNERRLLNFQRLLRIFIDYGLANERNKQAQRGAILSLPLLMTEQVVDGQDLSPLIRCLCELLVDAEPQLFYSLYLALQRLNLTLGDQRFFAYLRQCSPDAIILYKQAASRSGSMEQQSAQSSCMPGDQLQRRRSLRGSGDGPASDSGEKAAPTASGEQSKQVTFEADQPNQAAAAGEQQQRPPKRADSGASSSALGRHSPEADARDGELGGDDLDDELLMQMQTTPVAADYTIGGGLSDSSCAMSETSSLTSSILRAQPQQHLLDRARSSVSSTCSSEANLVDPAHYMNAAALSGHPMANYDQVHHVDHSATGLTINDICVSCSPTMELGPAAQNELRYGIFPRHLVQAALGARYLDRLEALQEMMCIIRDSPINHLAILMTYFDSFLGQFLAKLMEVGTDYKVELIAIDMIETIVIKTKFSSMQYIRPLVGLLVKSLADPRQQTLFRDNSVRVIHKMMAFLPPQHVIDAIFEHKHSKSALVREESVNRVTAAVLEYDRNEFNLTKLCYHVLPMLADGQASVRLAALECIATLAHALGPERIGSLLTAAEAVQTGCDYDGFLDAINARIMRRSLPRCNADGSIRHVIKPFLSAAGTTHHQEHQAPDVRWVLEAPSQHQHPQAHHQLEHHHEEAEHHAHRPGVYSPVAAGISQRRCSVPAALIHDDDHDDGPQEHHHHHHHPHHQRQQQQQKYGTNKTNGGHRSDSKQQSLATDASIKCDSVTKAAASSSGGGGESGHSPHPAAAASGEQRPTKQQQHEPKGAAPYTAQRRDSHSKGHSDIQKSPTATSSGNTSEIGKRRQSRLSGGSQAEMRVADKQASSSSAGRAAAATTKRSCSQDSNSSTDTNKVLFQYYLGKFKQSLEDTGDYAAMQSVLPSDSIIYTDIVQAYELSRHQSRYQQTSFDYDSGPGGRGVPIGIISDQPPSGGGEASIKNDDLPARNDSLSVSRSQRGASSSNSLERGGGDSSRSESPQTIMDVSGPDTSNLEGSPRERISSLKAATTTIEQSAGESNDRSQQEAERDHNTKQRQQQQQQARRASSRHSSRGDTADGETTVVQQHGDDDEGQQEKHMGSTAAAAQRKQSRQMSDRKSSSSQNAANDADGSGRADASGKQCDMTESELQEPSSSASRSHNSGQQATATTRARGLVRQSASAIAADADAAEAEAGSLDDPEEAGPPEEHQQRGERPSVGVDLRQRQHSPPARQESTGTTDSHSSQRSADHATQTTPQHGDHSRQSRRRRGSRRASGARREPREEPAKGAPETDDESFNDEVDESQKQQQQLNHEREIRRRASRSQPPARQLSRSSSRSHLPSRGKDTTTTPQDVRRSVSVSPSVATNVNIRHILENVALTEGSFQEPQLAFRVAMEALSGPCWSTKVEGILALIRLAAYHQQVLLGRLHEVVCRVANETRNLRSTVARSAIFALGDFCAKLERSIETEMETIVQALLQKSIENTAFIRDDIRRALTTMVEHQTQWRLAVALITHGSTHKNMHVRRMASQFVAALVERMGSARCLVGARDISAKLIPAAAKFAQDSSPHTRYYGRLILARIMQHSAFERLLRKTLVPNMYRSTIGIVESIKRRGIGDPPVDA